MLNKQNNSNSHRDTSISGIGNVLILKSPMGAIFMGTNKSEVECASRSVSGNLPGAHYNPAEARVPAGNHRESGRWTDEDDSGDAQLTPVATHSPKPPSIDPTVLKKKNFVNQHAALAQKIADQLGTTQKNILTIMAKESTWGQGNGPTRPWHNFVEDGFNLFSIHCPNELAWKCEPSDKDPDVKVAYFMSYADSGQAFVNLVTPKVQGVTDSTQFVTTLQDKYRFGWEPVLDDQHHVKRDAHGKKMYEPNLGYISDFTKIYKNLPDPDNSR